MKESILLVDGMALLFRGFFANSYGGYIRKTSSGVPVNAVYGFVKYLLDAVRTFKPTHVACCWDMGSKTFRTEKFAAYKANRPEPPLEMLPQFDLVKKVTESFGIPNIGVAGYEADDCIGTLASELRDRMDVYALTGDHDLLQLVTDQVKIIIMNKGASNYTVYDPDTLLQEKQLTAAQIIELKAMIGDSSDNYPGVRGIGGKTAVKLLMEYHTVEGIIENLHNLPKGIRAKIETDLEMLHLCRDLATIRCGVPLTYSMDDCRWEPDHSRVRELFEELEFKGLLKDPDPFSSVV